MADRPTQEWLKPDTYDGSAKKVGNSLPIPTEDTLTLEQSRKGNRAGETADWLPAAGFYTMTAKGAIVAPHTGDLIGGRHPQQGPSKIDAEDADGVFVVKPLPGARRQLVNPDETKPIQYPGGF